MDNLSFVDGEFAAGERLDRSPKETASSATTSQTRPVKGKESTVQEESGRHNAAQWLAKLAKHSKSRNGVELRKLRCQILTGTVEALDKQRYLDKEGKSAALPRTALFRGKTTRHSEETMPPGVPPDGESAVLSVTVRNQDCLVACQSIKRENPGQKVAVLNMANQHSPGGGWHSIGALCRRR